MIGMTKREKVISTANMMLDDMDKPELPEIRSSVTFAMKMYDVDEAETERLVKLVEAMRNTDVGDPSGMYDPTGHEPWLPDAKGKLPWNFWKRYETYHRDYKQWPSKTLQRLDEVTDDILGALEDADRPAPWDIRGMVVGQVQSGKTANYTGLICKAIDANYRLIIVLSGIHNNLRVQTQMRIDEGVIGFDTKSSLNPEIASIPIGVGQIRLPGNPNMKVHNQTTSADNGDFNTAAARRSNPHIGQEPYILVVKKNVTMLRNIEEWAKNMSVTDEDGMQHVMGVPLLLIDDEADNASINTKELPKEEAVDYEVTAINKGIRRILKLFEKSAYIGYTATPFANIFVHSNATHEQLGDDIFPRNFIINLPVPDNYIGPQAMFGMSTKYGTSLHETVLKGVTDWEDSFPSKHNRLWVPPELPKSLEDAILSYLLTCRLRTMAGQGTEHSSMLVHVSRFVDVQNHTKGLIDEYVSAAKRQFEHRQYGALTERMREIWETDYSKKGDALCEEQYKDPKWAEYTWMDILDGLYESTAKIEVKALNGYANDTLDYYENSKKGLHAIVVGGDKLQRGLTLEGLSVSYFLRSSKMYDTLMQMGRWFGYRPGYLHLCRLYITLDLVFAYNRIARASQELSEQFDEMAARNARPSEFGLRVRAHPDGLLMITAVNKMKNGTKLQISYAGSLIETKHFDKSSETRQLNLTSTNRFVQSLAQPTRKSGNNLVWEDITAEDVSFFLRGYKATNEYVTSSSGNLLADYIAKQKAQHELTEWTVVLMSVGTALKAGGTTEVGGHTIGLTSRKATDADAVPEDRTDTVYSLNRSRLGSTSDEAIDLIKDQEAVATAETIKAWEEGRLKKKKTRPTEATAEFLRAQRVPAKGLLLLYVLDPTNSGGETPFVGYGVSFPGSRTASSVTYVVNNVFMDNDYDY